MKSNLFGVVIVHIYLSVNRKVMAAFGTVKEWNTKKKNGGKEDSGIKDMMHALN